MNKVTTQDVYVEYTPTNALSDNTKVCHWNGEDWIPNESLEKQTNKIVFNKGEFSNMIKKAFEAGRNYQRGEHNEYHGGSDNNNPDFAKYFNSLF